MADIQEIPLDIAEEVQDIVEDIAEIKAGEEPVILDLGEEVKPVRQNTQSIKPKAKGRPKGICNKGPSKPRAKKTQMLETPAEAPVEEFTKEESQIAHGP